MKCVSLGSLELGTCLFTSAGKQRPVGCAGESVAMGSGDCFAQLFSLALPEMTEWGISELLCSVPGCKGRAFPSLSSSPSPDSLTFCLALGLKVSAEGNTKHQKGSEVVCGVGQKLKHDYLKGGKEKAKLFSLPQFW